MKFLTAALALILTQAVEGGFSGTYPYPEGALSGNENCAVIHVVMDQSGSMENDQNWFSGTVTKLMLDGVKDKGVQNVFFCSSGFGMGDAGDYKFFGCQDLTDWDGYGGSDLDIYSDWVHAGDHEDSYEAIYKATDDLPAVIDGKDLEQTCGFLHKNMILVTDEERYVKNAEITDAQVMSKLYDYPRDWVLNEVVQVRWYGFGGYQIGAKFEGYDCAGFDCPQFSFFKPSFSQPTKAFEHHPFGNAHSYQDSAEGDSDKQYPQLVDGQAGAMWDIATLRDTSTSEAFTDAFIKVKIDEVKVPEITPTTSPPSASKPPTPVGTNGDPHFTTWGGEHFEYHGQCDMVLSKDPQFANGLGMDIHIRTKIVRFWSYIKSAVIRIGTDILEVQGSPDDDDWESHYWINYEYQGELTEISGFPVTNTAPASAYKRTYEIDLSSKYPGQSIVIQVYKEFIRVDIKNASFDAFGKTVGMLGEFGSGKTFARDGTTVLDDFAELGHEWQVLPAEPKLFHEMTHPQFPERCIDPEDPRGERRRRLDESAVTTEQAEAACASIKDPLDKKDCIYDVFATQDLDMVGAF